MGPINLDLLLDPTDWDLAGTDSALHLSEGNASEARRSHIISHLPRSLHYAQSHRDYSLRQTVACCRMVSGYQYSEDNFAAGRFLHLHYQLNSTVVLAIR